MRFFFIQVEKHIKRLETELEKLDELDPSLIIPGSISTPSVASSFELPRKTASTIAFNRGWETPVAAGINYVISISSYFINSSCPNTKTNGWQFVTEKCDIREKNSEKKNWRCFWRRCGH